MTPAWPVILALVGGAGTSPMPECRPEAAATRAVRAVATGIVAADNRRDIEAVLASYAADAVLLPPGEGPVVGRESIRPRYEALFSKFDPAIEVVVEDACAGGALGFVRGRNAGHLTERGSREVRALDDAFVMLLRRDPRHGWQISHLIWNRRTAAPAAQ